MYKIAAYILILILTVSIVAQEQPAKDTDWEEINKLILEYSENEINSAEITTKLINSLVTYLEKHDIDQERSKIALNFLISIYKKGEKFEEISALTQKYITQNLASPIQNFLRIEKHNALFNLEKYESLTKSTDEYIKELKKLEITDDVRVYITKSLVIKAKAMILTGKTDIDTILREIDEIIEEFSNRSNILSVKLEKTDLQRFKLLHNSAKLEDWETTDFNEEIVHLSDYNGKKVMLMFWASWEGRCSYFFEKKIEKFAEKLASQGIELIAISSEKIDDQKTFLEKTELTCKFVYDKQSKVTRSLFIESLPYFVYIDKDAKVITSGDLNSYDKMMALITENDEKED